MLIYFWYGQIRSSYRKEVIQPQLCTFSPLWKYKVITLFCHCQRNREFQITLHLAYHVNFGFSYTALSIKCWTHYKSLWQKFICASLSLAKHKILYFAYVYSQVIMIMMIWSQLEMTQFHYLHLFSNSFSLK